MRHPTTTGLAALSAAALLVLMACSSGTASTTSAAAGGRSTSDPRVRSFMGAQLPGGSGGEWLRAATNPAPKVIYYQFAFPR